MLFSPSMDPHPFSSQNNKFLDVVSFEIGGETIHGRKRYSSYGSPYKHDAYEEYPEAKYTHYRLSGENNTVILESDPFMPKVFIYVPK